MQAGINMFWKKPTWFALAVVISFNIPFIAVNSGEITNSLLSDSDVAQSRVKERPIPAQGDTDTLRLMIWEGYAPREHVEKFEKEIEEKYHRKVTLEISVAESSDDFFDVVRNKSIDLITISHHSVKDDRYNYITKRLILPFDPENIPNHSNLIGEYKNGDFHVSNGKIYGVPVANGPYGLAYNTEKLKQAPQSWKIFWDPAYKKQYIIGENEYLYNINITALALGYPRESIGSFDALNNKEFYEKLRALAVNAHSFWIGVDKAEELVGLTFATSWGDSLSSLKRMGEIWKMATPQEGILWWIDEYALTWALTDRPFIKKVAEEWINYSLSPEFQLEHIVREVGIFPVVTNISDKLTEEEKSRILPGPDRSIMDQRILQHTYSQRDRNGLKLMWDKAMKSRKPLGETN